MKLLNQFSEHGADTQTVFQLIEPGNKSSLDRPDHPGDHADFFHISISNGRREKGFIRTEVGSNLFVVFFAFSDGSSGW